MKLITRIAAFLAALGLAGCIAVPPGSRLASVCAIGTNICWYPRH